MVYCIWWILPYLFFGIIVFLDFITLGGSLRRKRFVGEEFGINYNDSLNCFFTRHPNNDEEGLICNFNIEHLTKGNHLLELERDVQYNVERDKTIINSYKLPFIKEF